MTNVTETETDGEEVSAGSIRLPLFVLAVIGAAQTMDPSISNVALVDATAALQIPAGSLSLAATISTLAAAATVITSGYLADRLGRRRVLLVALLLSAVGDLLAAGAIGTPMYMLGRLLAGAGLGAAFSASFAYVRTVAGEGKLGSALGLWTAQLTFLAILGGVLGGVLTQSVSWRLAMCIVPALCLVGALATLRVLPVVPPVDQEKPDYLGQALLMGGVAGVLLGVANFATTFTGPRTLVPLVGGLVALGAFAIVELRSDHPVFPIRIFTNKVFVAAVMVGALWNLIDGSVVLQFSNLWQYVMKYGTGFVSLGQLPLAAAMIVSATIVGKKLSGGTRIRTFFVLGVVFAVLGFLSMTILHTDSPFPVFLPGLMLIGVGIGCFNTPSASLFVSQAPKESYGVVTSSRLMVGQFGYSMATAISSVLVNDFTEGGVTKKLEAAGVAPDDVGTAWTGVSDYVRMNTPLPSTTAAQQALQAAGPSYVHAFIVAMLIFGAITIVVGLTAAWLVRNLPGVAQAPAEGDGGDPAGAGARDATTAPGTAGDAPPDAAPSPA
jgi:MFS family permease